jgi:hypothetical protein
MFTLLYLPKKITFVCIAIKLSLIVKGLLCTKVDQRLRGSTLRDTVKK